MTFMNVTRAGIYLQCCHREVEPGGVFVVPWSEGRSDRALRAAMADGALAWRSGAGEPEVPGSAHFPTPDELSKAEAERAEVRAKDEAEKARMLAERRKADDAGVKANMARMGDFNVPKLTPRRSPALDVKRERPVTREDVITGDGPRSLADIARHNRAIKKFGPKAGAAEPNGKEAANGG